MQRVIHTILYVLAQKAPCSVFNNGHRNYIEGVLEVVERSGGFSDFCYVWKKPQLREALRLYLGLARDNRGDA